MIDYLKINELSIGLKIQGLLDFELKVNQTTGEELVYKKKSAYLKNLIFTITPGGGYVKVQGSLHKFANGGEKNNDRFTLDRFLGIAEVLKDLIFPNDIINVLEFGVNIHTPFDPSEFINNLIAHLNKPFNKTINPGIEYSQVEYSHFILKIYNKGLQQGPAGSYILRIEAKYLKMQRLFEKGLKWSDLCEKKTWMYLGETLQKKFSEVVYYDPSIDLEKIPEKHRLIIEKGHNPIFWESQTGPHVSRSRKQYQALIKTYGKKFNNLPELLANEIQELVKCSHFSPAENHKAISDHFPELVNCSTLLYGNNSPSDNLTLSDRVFCQVTGADISNQKPGSKFLSHSGIKEMMKTAPAEFEKLREQRLSRRWNSASVEVQVREIAHSIRNEFYNPKHDAVRDIKKLYKQPALFDVWALIKEDKRKLALRGTSSSVSPESLSGLPAGPVHPRGPFLTQISTYSPIL